MEVALPDLMKQEEFVDYKTLAPKLLALNNWILDGELKSGTGKPAYRSDGASGVGLAVVVVSTVFFFHVSI